MRPFFRLTTVRIVSQLVFLGLFVFGVWATWTTRMQGYPVSRFLELDPLVALSTALSTGHIYRYLGWSILLLLLTLLFGRLFCNWICPLGTLHQFAGWLFNVRSGKERQEQNRYHPRQVIKYVILIIVLIISVFGSVQIGLLDPLALLHRSMVTGLSTGWDWLLGTTSLTQLQLAPGTAERIYTGSLWIGVLVVFIIGINIWRSRFFCRTLCPLGALLGVFSAFSLFRIHRDTDLCTNCDLCLTRCEGACSPETTLRVTECVGCMNCIDDCPENALSFSLPRIVSAPVQSAPDLSRRHLVFAGIIGLITFPLLRANGRVNDANYSPLMIRPPGSVAEAEFLKKCIKCGQCMRVCPTNVVQPAGLREGGIEALWTPVLNFNIGHCQQKCSLCSTVCPTGAIREISATEKLGFGEYRQDGPIRLGTAFINRSRCLPWANEIPCIVCQEVCPIAPKAIQTYDEEVKDTFGHLVLLNKPFIIPDLCTGCGICQKECPVTDLPAAYITAVGESRSQERRLLLRYRTNPEES
jgi:polyferredoxin